MTVKKTEEIREQVTVNDEGELTEEQMNDVAGGVVASKLGVQIMAAACKAEARRRKKMKDAADQLGAKLVRILTRNRK